VPPTLLARADLRRRHGVKQLERRRDANSVDAAQNNKTALKEISLIDTQIDALRRDRRTLSSALSQTEQLAKDDAWLCPRLTSPAARWRAV
jgi:hypothetical protein